MDDCRKSEANTYTHTPDLGSPLGSKVTTLEVDILLSISLCVHVGGSRGCAHCTVVPPPTSHLFNLARGNVLGCVFNCKTQIKSLCCSKRSLGTQPTKGAKGCLTGSFGH